MSSSSASLLSGIHVLRVHRPGAAGGAAAAGQGSRDRGRHSAAGASSDRVRQPGRGATLLTKRHHRVRGIALHGDESHAARTIIEHGRHPSQLFQRRDRASRSPRSRSSKRSGPWRPSPRPAATSSEVGGRSGRGAADTTAEACVMLRHAPTRQYACGSGGIGRRTSLRGWRWQHRGGSNPPFRTTHTPGRAGPRQNQGRVAQKPVSGARAMKSSQKGSSCSAGSSMASTQRKSRNPAARIAASYVTGFR